MGPPCLGMFPLCKRCRRRGAHRSPMLSNRDCAKRQVGMGMWRQTRSPIGQRHSKLRADASRAIPVRGAINAIGSVTDGRRTSARVMRQLARQGSSSSSHAPPIPRCAQLSGGPARNRVVFINGRRLEGAICPSRETVTGNAKHKARSANPGRALPTLPSRAQHPS